MRSTADGASARRQIALGLTGNIACGKSTVCTMLEELGAEIIDADRVVHDVMRVPAIVHAVAERFGAEVLGSDGQIDRRKLGTIVFADAQAMSDLEGILYPETLRRVGELVAASPAEVVVTDAIKLYEAGLAAKCDVVWVVTCAVEQQVQRLVTARGLSEEEAWLRIRSQPPQKEKAARADVVIENSGTLGQTRQQVRAAFDRLLAPERAG